MGEAHLLQLLICRPNVWTLLPGAAAAINDDGLRRVQSTYPILKQFKSRRLRGRAYVLRSRDMSLGKKDVRTNLQDDRLLCRILQHRNKLLRKHQGLLRNGTIGICSELKSRRRFSFLHTEHERCHQQEASERRRERSKDRFFRNEHLYLLYAKRFARDASSNANIRGACLSFQELAASTEPSYLGIPTE